MMKTRILPLASCVLAFAAIGPSTVQAALELTYDVAIVDSMGNPFAGSVSVGTQIFWRISAVVTGTPTSGSNFGIAQVSTDLTITAGETLSTGTVGPLFTSGGYFTSGGTVGVPPDELTIIQATQVTQNNATTVGVGSSGSFLLASGSYIAANPGVHTLTTVANVDDSLYFSAAGQGVGAAASYESIMFDSATITVTQANIPEPSSLALMGLAACGATLLRKRRRSCPADTQPPTT